MSRTTKGPDGGKQKLSPMARRDKQARDKAYMMGDYKHKKAYNQRWHRANPQHAGKDYDHKDRRAENPSENRDSSNERNY